jgi:hypothetical protein
VVASGRWPGIPITLRQGARVIEDTPSSRRLSDREAVRVRRRLTIDLLSYSDAV